MERVAVASSNVASVGYDPAARTLEVAFLNGSVYQYAQVPAEAHEALMAASSVGGHLHRHIRSVYPVQRLA